MTPKVIGFFVFVWVVAIILGSVYDYRSDLCTTDTQGITHCYDTTMNYLVNMDNAFMQTDFLSLSIPVPNPDYIETLTQAMTLQFSFFHGNWWLLWAVVCGPLVAMGIFGMLTWALQIFQGFLPWVLL